MGITISLAGSPNIKANKITPSSPKSVAKGFKKFAQWLKTELLPIDIFAIIQIISPAGAATETLRPKTKSVLSKIERIKSFNICGLRYGGSSNV